MFVSYIVTPRVNPKDVKATHKFIFVSKNEPCWGLQRYLSLLKRFDLFTNVFRKDKLYNSVTSRVLVSVLWVWKS